MNYVSIDIETTGLDYNNHSILSIGAIIEDTTYKLDFDKVPKFKALIIHKEVVGQLRALRINQNILGYLCDYNEGDNKVREELVKTTGYQFYDKEEVVKRFFEFLFINGLGYDLTTAKNTRYINGGIRVPIIDSTTQPIHITAAGKNFATFDKLFLDQLPWWKKLIRTRQRVIDPSVLYVDWSKDLSLPTLSDCKERANMSGVVEHTALEDAWDVVQLLRKFY